MDISESLKAKIKETINSFGLSLKSIELKEANCLTRNIFTITVGYKQNGEIKEHKFLFDSFENDLIKKIKLVISTWKKVNKIV